MRIKLLVTRTKDEGGRMRDEVKAQQLSLPPSSFILHLFNRRRLATLCALAVLLTSLPPARTSAQQSTQPPGTNSTQTRTQTPGTPQPSPTQLPPNASGSTVRPSNDAQQSTQPQTVPEQQRQQTAPNTQGPRPETPQNPVQTQTGTGQPSTATPAGTSGGQTTTTGTPSTTGGAQQTTTGATPGQNVGTSGVAPAELPLPPPPISPDFRAPQRPLPSAERVGVDVADQVTLTLSDAIRMALKNSNDIDESRIDVQIAEYNLTAARGVYDPVISSESYYERSSVPTSSTLGGAGVGGAVNQTDATGSGRLAGFSPWAGGNYQLDFSSTRLTTTNQNVRLNPQFPSAFSITYSQPILRGLRFDNNRRQIEIAKRNLSLSDAQFRQRAIDVISQVEQAYWDLAFSLRNLQVQIDAVKQARLQVESNQRLVAQGVLAPIDIVAAQTQVTTFEQSVYSAQESVTTAENTLKTLILADRTADLWARAITPVTPVDLEAPRVPLEQAVTAALANRLDLAQLRTSSDINDVNVRFFRDQTRPQLDLVGNYSGAGLAGTFVAPVVTVNAVTQRVNDLSVIAGLPPLPAATPATIAPNLVGGYTQSLANLFEQKYPTARVGVRLSLPLRNRTAEANLGSSLAQGRRINDQIRQAKQIIEADVRNSLQAVRSAEARLASAAASRSSAEQQYASEQRQLRAGTTTVFLVLQRQTELLAARARELQAQTDLNKAVSALNRATGSTLQANNVAVKTDSALPQLEQTKPADDPTLDAKATATPGASNVAPGARP
ncbi:MAG: TolC family protein [Pyrinomonadaceae bacterium]